MTHHLWQVVQDKLATNRQERALGVGAKSPSLLVGLIVDAEGQTIDADPRQQAWQALSLLHLDVASRWKKESRAGHIPSSGRAR